MNLVNVNDLELQEVASASDPTVLTRFNFPIYAATGASSTAVVYFEVEPGKRLASHHDGAEEVLFIVQGEGVATVGGNSGRVRAGDLAVVPAWVTHGVENTGDVTLKVVGFFGSATLAHMFAESLIPGDGALTILHTVDGEAVYSATSLLQPAGVG
jgi:mannose-6-phosphate isomerase-like protein (cupin superfamily)